MNLRTVLIKSQTLFTRSVIRGRGLQKVLCTNRCCLVWSSLYVENKTSWNQTDSGKTKTLWATVETIKESSGSKRVKVQIEKQLPVLVKKPALTGPFNLSDESCHANTAGRTFGVKQPLLKEASIKQVIRSVRAEQPLRVVMHQNPSSPLKSKRSLKWMLMCRHFFHQISGTFSLSLALLVFSEISSPETKSHRHFNKVTQDIKKLLGRDASSVQLLMKKKTRPSTWLARRGRDETCLWSFNSF